MARDSSAFPPKLTRRDTLTVTVSQEMAFPIRHNVGVSSKEVFIALIELVEGHGKDTLCLHVGSKEKTRNQHVEEQHGGGYLVLYIGKDCVAMAFMCIGSTKNVFRKPLLAMYNITRKPRER
jgi:hypothetical protein